MFSTTFRRVDGMEIIAPNALLAGSKLVHNLRRSNSMYVAVLKMFLLSADLIAIRWESTNLQVAYDTPLEVIEQLRIRLQAYVNANNREWSNVAVNIDKMEYQNAITLIIAMEHRPNWQDWGGRWVRRTAFMRHLKAVLEDLDVRYMQPVQPIVLPRGSGFGPQASPYLDLPPSPRSRRAPGPDAREDLGNAGYMDRDALARSPSRSLRPGGDRF